MDPIVTRPTITPVLWYRNPTAALAFLERAFGFETRMIVNGEDGGVAHSETAIGDGLVMVVGPPRDLGVSPADWSGRYTSGTHVQLTEGIDAHYDRARAAGARITREIATQPYGDRIYVCQDLEDHHWSFGQTVKPMTIDQMARATGEPIQTSLEQKDS
jgi:uncharacterized glyoxalase superfamily protein PhnB